MLHKTDLKSWNAILATKRSAGMPFQQIGGLELMISHSPCEYPNQWAKEAAFFPLVLPALLCGIRWASEQDYWIRPNMQIRQRNTYLAPDSGLQIKIGAYLYGRSRV